MAGKGKLLAKGLGGVGPGVWGAVAAGALATTLTVLGLPRQGAAMSWVYGIVALLCAAVFFFALGAWVWTGPVMAPWRKEQEHRRAMAVLDTKRAAIRADFEARFSGWPEFSRHTSLMTLIVSAEEDRKRGFTRDDVASWPEFVAAASAARVAAESLWEGWREEAIRVTTPPAKLREPIDYEVAYEATVWLRLFCQEKGAALSKMASSAGITDDYVRRLREGILGRQ